MGKKRGSIPYAIRDFDVHDKIGQPPTVLCGFARVAQGCTFSDNCIIHGLSVLGKGIAVFDQNSIADKKNTGAFDRCYSLFSAYDKEAYAAEENVYTIKVYYQDFDQREIISRRRRAGAGGYQGRDCRTPESSVDNLPGLIRKTKNVQSVTDWAIFCCS